MHAVCFSPTPTRREEVVRKSFSEMDKVLLQSDRSSIINLGWKKTRVRKWDKRLFDMEDSICDLLQMLVRGQLPVSPVFLPAELLLLELWTWSWGRRRVCFCPMAHLVHSSCLPPCGHCGNCCRPHRTWTNTITECNDCWLSAQGSELLPLFSINAYCVYKNNYW